MGAEMLLMATKIMLTTAARLKALNLKQGKRKKISTGFRIELNDFYREDVLKLSKLLGRNLSHWVSNSGL